jgi:hypothetical protein
LFLLDLNRPALTDAEAMYAEIAREMHVLGDWITPHLNGTPHFDKPPLVYWLIGLAQFVFGVNEFSARFWTALAAWATIPVVGAIGGAIYGRRAGWISALVYATSVGPFIFGRLAMPDPIFTFWIALAILGYVKGYCQEPGRGGFWPWLMFGCAGLAVLTKGILGIALPAAVIGMHMLLSGRARSLASWRTVAGICLTFAIAAPWHIAATDDNSGFLWYYVIREHLLRFTGTRFPPDEVVPLPVFLVLSLVWTFPWIAMAPQAIWRGIKRLSRTEPSGAGDMLSLIWIVVIVGLFSVSRSRLEYYALPSLPAFALLYGRLWDELLDKPAEGSASRSLVLGFTVMTVALGLAALAAIVVLGPYKDLIFHAFMKWWPSGGWVGDTAQAAVVERMRLPAIVTLAGTTAAALCVLFTVHRSRIRTAIYILAAMMVPILAMVHWGFLVREPLVSSRPLAKIELSVATPRDIVVYQEPYEYMWVGGITFYTGRMVYILKDPRFDGVRGRPRKPPERFLNFTQLEKLWSSSAKVLLIADADGDLPTKLAQTGRTYVIGKSGSKVVLANMPKSELSTSSGGKSQ